MDGGVFKDDAGYQDIIEVRDGLKRLENGTVDHPYIISDDSGAEPTAGETSTGTSSDESVEPESLSEEEEKKEKEEEEMESPEEVVSEVDNDSSDAYTSNESDTEVEAAVALAMLDDDLRGQFIKDKKSNAESDADSDANSDRDAEEEEEEEEDAVAAVIEDIFVYKAYYNLISEADREKMLEKLEPLQRMAINAEKLKTGADGEEAPGESLADKIETVKKKYLADIEDFKKTSEGRAERKALGKAAMASLKLTEDITVEQIEEAKDAAKAEFESKLKELSNYQKATFKNTIKEFQSLEDTFGVDNVFSTIDSRTFKLPKGGDTVVRPDKNETLTWPEGKWEMRRTFTEGGKDTGKKHTKKSAANRNKEKEEGEDDVREGDPKLSKDKYDWYLRFTPAAPMKVKLLSDTTTKISKIVSATELPSLLEGAKSVGKIQFRQPGRLEKGMPYLPDKIDGDKARVFVPFLWFWNQQPHEVTPVSKKAEIRETRQKRDVRLKNLQAVLRFKKDESRMALGEDKILQAAVARLAKYMASDDRRRKKEAQKQRAREQRKKDLEERRKKREEAKKRRAALRIKAKKVRDEFRKGYLNRVKKVKYAYPAALKPGAPKTWTRQAKLKDGSTVSKRVPEELIVRFEKDYKMTVNEKEYKVLKRGVASDDNEAQFLDVQRDGGMKARYEIKRLARKNGYWWEVAERLARENRSAEVAKAYRVSEKYKEFMNTPLYQKWSKHKNAKTEEEKASFPALTEEERGEFKKMKEPFQAWLDNDNAEDPDATESGKFEILKRTIQQSTYVQDQWSKKKPIAVLYAYRNKDKLAEMKKTYEERKQRKAEEMKKRREEKEARKKEYEKRRKERRKQEKLRKKIKKALDEDDYQKYEKIGVALDLKRRVDDAGDSSGSFDSDLTEEQKKTLSELENQRVTVSFASAFALWFQENKDSDELLARVKNEFLEKNDTEIELQQLFFDQMLVLDENGYFEYDLDTELPRGQKYKFHNDYLKDKFREIWRNEVEDDKKQEYEEKAQEGRDKQREDMQSIQPKILEALGWLASLKDDAAKTVVDALLAKKGMWKYLKTTLNEDIRADVRAAFKQSITAWLSDDNRETWFKDQNEKEGLDATAEETDEENDPGVDPSTDDDGFDELFGDSDIEEEEKGEEEEEEEEKGEEEEEEEEKEEEEEEEKEEKEEDSANSSDEDPDDDDMGIGERRTGAPRKGVLDESDEED